MGHTPDSGNRGLIDLNDAHEAYGSRATKEHRRTQSESRVEAVATTFIELMLRDVSLRRYVEGNDLRQLRDAYRVRVSTCLVNGVSGLLDLDGRMYRGVDLIRVQNHMTVALGTSRWA